MEAETEKSERTAAFSVNGATCPSCVFAIEHSARKISGIHDIRVNAAEQTLTVTYDGDPACLSGVAEIVRRLGYEAELIR